MLLFYFRYLYIVEIEANYEFLLHSAYRDLERVYVDTRRDFDTNLHSQNGKVLKKYAYDVLVPAILNVYEEWEVIALPTTPEAIEFMFRLQTHLWRHCTVKHNNVPQ